MKKIILIVCAAVASISLWAQDVIVTKDAKKIEAKILEVSKSEIKYKDWDNQDGPTFILETTEISTIIYSNGKVALYNQESSDKKADAAQTKVEQERVAPVEQAPSVNVDFEIASTSDPLFFRFINRSTGASEFRWDFGDGKFSFAPEEALYTYEKAGTYTVTLSTTVNNQKYEQKRILTAGQRKQEVDAQQLDRTIEKSAESGAQLGQSIRRLIDSKNSYAIDITNSTKYPYRINLDGHILGVVNPYKTQRFIVDVSIYGRMQAVQTSGYMFSPTIKEFKIPRQQKQTACSVVIK